MQLVRWLLASSHALLLLMASFWFMYARPILDVLREEWDRMRSTTATDGKTPRHLAIVVSARSSPAQLIAVSRLIIKHRICQMTIIHTDTDLYDLGRAFARDAIDITIRGEAQALIIRDGVLADTPLLDADRQVPLLRVISSSPVNTINSVVGSGNADPNKTLRHLWGVTDNLPDLVLVCDGSISANSMCLNGCPSWLLKNAELGVLPPIDNLLPSHLQRCLRQYARSVQRNGQ